MKDEMGSNQSPKATVNQRGASQQARGEGVNEQHQARADLCVTKKRGPHRRKKAKINIAMNWREPEKRY